MLPLIISDFRNFALAVHLRPKQSVLMLKAYFDDSGQAEQAVGGCVASVEAWIEIETEWRAVLHDHDLIWFHASEFEHGAPGFQHLCDAERDVIRNELIGVLTRHITLKQISGYVCAIIPPGGVKTARFIGEASRKKLKKGQSQRKEWYERYTEQAIALIHDPYCICLASCFRMTLNHIVVPAEETVEIFIAYQQKMKAKTDMLYSMATATPRFADRFVGLHNGPDMNPRQLIPLQAADFAAYYLSRTRRNSRDEVARNVSRQLKWHFVEVSDGMRLTDRWLQPHDAILLQEPRTP